MKQDCARALHAAILTAPDAELLKKLDAVMGRLKG